MSKLLKCEFTSEKYTYCGAWCKYYNTCTREPYKAPERKTDEQSSINRSIDQRSRG